VGIAGLGAGLKFISQEGIDKILAHEQNLTTSLLEGLYQTPGVTVHAAKDGKRQAPIVSFTTDNVEPGEVGAILDQAFDIKVRTGLQCAPVAHKTLGTFPLGTIRLSPGYFNNMEEIELTIKAIERVARSGRNLKELHTGLCQRAL
jgi:selenocysteine lyase/cysteine desulfurase